MSRKGNRDQSSTCMTKLHYKHLKRKTRREFEKRFGGYIAELSLNLSYSLQEKREAHTKFVIISFQRTGSTLLVSLLDSHPLIHCAGELLLNKMNSPFKYIERKSMLSNSTAFGFKLLIPHFYYQDIPDPQNFLSELHGRGYRIIKLVRRNLLLSAVSLQYALISGLFHHNIHAGELRKEKIRVNPQDLIERIEWIESTSQLLEKITANLPHIDVVYEDHLLLSEHHQSTVNMLVDYLGLPHAIVHSDLVKTMPDDIAQYLTNADEVVQYLKATKYVQYLKSQ